MNRQQSRLSAAFVSFLVAVGCLAVLVFLLAGPHNFVDLWLVAGRQIAVISLGAGVVRLWFRPNSLAISLACGITVAIAGYLIVLFSAIARI